MTATTIPFAEAHKLFDGYNIHTLEIKDVVGEGTELNAYDKSSKWIELPIDIDEASCVDEMDWEYQLDAIYKLLNEKVGEYESVAGTLTRIENTFIFDGVASKPVRA